MTSTEEKALAPWGWSKNEAILHWDERVSPIRLQSSIAHIQFIPVRRRAYSGASVTKRAELYSYQLGTTSHPRPNPTVRRTPRRPRSTPLRCASNHDNLGLD